MKAFKFILKEIIYPGSFIFTLYNIFMQLIAPADDDHPEKLKTFFLILLCCLAMALVNKIFKADMSLPAKIGIHYAGLVLSIIGIFVIMGNDHAIAAVFFAVTIVYAVIAIPTLLIYNKIKKNKNEDEKYDTQFK